MRATLLTGLKGLFYRVSNIPDRLFKISKSYLDQVRDRIDSELTERERAQAEQELRSRGEDASLPAFADESGPDEFHAADDMMRRAEERIAAARREREARSAAAQAQTAAAPPTLAANPAQTAAENADPNASDYRVLGVPVGSDLMTVLSAYEKLSRRCDPRRFPEGSKEQAEATRILARVNTSYENLRKRLDPTENRFGKLELE